jgi:hypothetical protein
MSKDDDVEIIPATGIMIIKQDGKSYIVLAYEVDNTYIAISISVDEVLKHLKEDNYICNIPEKPKDKMVV